jgi:transposase-like protein
MKLTPGKTSAEREKYWVKIINEARRYPLGVTAYLLEHDYEKENYYQWFKKLRPTHPEWTDLSKDRRHHSMKQRAKMKGKIPQTEVLEKSSRRRFSAKEKARILKEIDSAEQGQVAAILRREGLYSSHVQKWRLDMAQGSLEPQKRGPKPNPAAEEIKRLTAQLARTERKLARAKALIELQKKIDKILRTSIEESDED